VERYIVIEGSQGKIALIRVLRILRRAFVSLKPYLGCRKTYSEVISLDLIRTSKFSLCFWKVLIVRHHISAKTENGLNTFFLRTLQSLSKHLHMRFMFLAECMKTTDHLQIFLSLTAYSEDN
jgi:hypothetical protein